MSELESHCLSDQFEGYSSYLEHQKGSSISTLKHYRSELGLILNYLNEIGISTTDDLSLETVQVLETWLLDKKLKPRSRAKSLSVFKSFTSYLKISHKILFDIGKKITMPKFHRTQREVPSREEIKAYLFSPDTNTDIGKRDHLILSLLYYTGMRANELTNIFTQNINFSERSIKVFGKGGHRRLVYFPLSVGIKLKGYLRENKVFSLFGNITSNQVTCLCTKYFRKLNMPQRGAHILRYTIATHLFERGVNVRIIQTMLGHKSIQSTYEYILPRIDYLKEMHSKHHPFEKGLLS